ncbi:MAG: hypothetical protein ABSD92_12585, partial [Candidatus Bathyarchaeia archaeon]
MKSSINLSFKSKRIPCQTPKQRNNPKQTDPKNAKKSVVDGMGSIIRRRRSRHTMSALVCGLDVHKDSTYA